MFLNEGAMRLFVVNAASEHGQSGLLESREAVAERARLGSTSGGVVLGIEVEHHPMAGEVGQLDRSDLVAEYHLGCEFRRFRPFGEQFRCLRGAREQRDRNNGYSYWMPNANSHFS